MYILVLYRVLVNYNIKLSNILYHWELSMASFRFCETYLLQTTVRGQQQCDFSILGLHLVDSVFVALTLSF